MTAAALMLGYGPGFALALWVAARRDRKRRAEQVRDEWARLQSAVAQARADIAAEAEDFDLWEQEVSA